VALGEFVTGSHRWLTVERSTGPYGAVRTWDDVFAGAVPPQIGRIASLHD